MKTTNNRERRLGAILSRPFISIGRKIAALARWIGSKVVSAGKTIAAVPANTRRYALWLVFIMLAGLASDLIGKSVFPAPGCPQFRDFLLDWSALLVVGVVCIRAVLYPPARVGIMLQLITIVIPLVVPFLVATVGYPVGTQVPGIVNLYCPSCDQLKGEAQKLLNEAERLLSEGKIDQSLALLNTAQSQYAENAVTIQCPEAKCLLAQILNVQSEALFKSKNNAGAIQKLSDALKFAKEGSCQIAFVRQVEERRTHYAKESVAFSVAPPFVPLGASATLQWFADGASRVTLDGQIVEMQGSKRVTPTQTTKHALHVEFPDGSTKDLTATVIAYSFSVTPQIIPLGGSATLTWSAEGASKVTLDEQPVAVQGSKVVSPTKMTSYMLRIVFPDNSNKDMTSSVMVYSFSVTPQYIRSGESATLQWNAEGASKVTLDGQEVAVRGSKVVTPMQTTTYPLRAIFPGSTKDLSATVTIVSYSFTAIPQFIGANESSKLEWACPEASECTLDGQKVMARGSKSVSPLQTTTYTFKIKFPDGSTKDLEATVTVGQGPCEPLRYAALGYKRVTPILLQREIPLTPSIRIPNEFAHPESTITLQGDEIVCLASTPDGKGELKVDDQIDFSVTPRSKIWVENFYDPVTKGIKSHPAQNVSWMFAPGENRLKLILTDTIRGVYYSTYLWLIVWRQ